MLAVEQQGAAFDGLHNRQLNNIERKQRSYYHRLLETLIIATVFVIAGIVIGFVVVGLQGRDTSKIKSETDDIWEELEDVSHTLDAVQNCTEQLKDEFGNFTENFIANTTTAVLDGLSEFFPRVLPLARVLCDHEQDIPLPAATNVLISSNLTDADSFPHTSVDYNIESGAIVIASPSLQNGQVVIVRFEIRVFISNIDTDEDGTYSLILSTNANCALDDCPGGFYSFTSRYLSEAPEFGEGSQWISLMTNIPVQNGQRYFVFLRSNAGSGVVPGTETSDATACAALYISLTAVTPVFRTP